MPIHALLRFFPKQRFIVIFRSSDIFLTMFYIFIYVLVFPFSRSLPRRQIFLLFRNPTAMCNTDSAVKKGKKRRFEKHARDIREMLIVAAIVSGISGAVLSRVRSRLFVGWKGPAKKHGLWPFISPSRNWPFVRKLPRVISERYSRFLPIVPPTCIIQSWVRSR